MPAAVLDRAARTRRTRTRSRLVNSRPALALSTLKPHQYDLRPECPSAVCPDCRTWVSITSLTVVRPKLVPHDTGRAGKDDAVRCRGSVRVVKIDVKVKEWQDRLEDGHAETDHRRPTAVRRKPKAAVAPPADKVVPTLPTPDSTLKTYQLHRQRCAACHGGAHCPSGARLAGDWAKAVRVEPQLARHRRNRELLTQQAERAQTAALPARRRAEWASTLPQVRNADAQRAAIPRGQRPVDHPDIPLTPRST
ncbi:hypothetical protein [Streptomyces albidoflavus]|uniref:hypothetical protein n=1 Tax=Streptomyces albidoflavus TaxID=1886 RepID=UPI002F91A1DF|nr:hypothetical protein OHA76_00460 [Streptomyces albidoflavus]WSD57040.1 hypothetical protein OHA76_31740 [Streptomyces albidoflavus]WTE00930.1 hypothetical protein OG950_31225 [Streptomyces albidoflavus]